MYGFQLGYWIGRVSSSSANSVIPTFTIVVEFCHFSLNNKNISGNLFSILLRGWCLRFAYWISFSKNCVSRIPPNCFWGLSFRSNLFGHDAIKWSDFRLGALTSCRQPSDEPLKESKFGTLGTCVRRPSCKFLCHRLAEEFGANTGAE